MTETTSPGPRVTGLNVYLGYRDAAAALDWMERVLGATITSRFPDERGGVQHAEARLGDAAWSVFSDVDGYEYPAPRGDSVGAGTYLTASDEAAVDAAYRRAQAADADIVWPAGSTEWGNYRFRLRDPEGREWTFGTHVFGQQHDW